MAGADYLISTTGEVPQVQAPPDHEWIPPHSLSTFNSGGLLLLLPENTTKRAWIFVRGDIKR